MKDVKAENFENVRQLVHLNMSHNDIERIDRWSFGNCTNVQVLDLSNNQIEFIDDVVFGPVGVNTLYLNHNKLKTILWNQFYPDDLIILTLNENEIVSTGTAKCLITTRILFDISNNPLEGNTEIHVNGGQVHLQNTGALRLFLYMSIPVVCMRKTIKFQQ